MARAGAPKPLRFNHEKTESTLSVSMRSEKRFSFGVHGRAGGKRHAVVGMGSWLFAAFRDLKREP